MILYILLDAFRGDYINLEKTPYLYSLTKNKGNYFVKNVIPSHSFCERTEIFSGLTPKESGFFTAIGYNPDLSPFKQFKFILKFLHLFEKIILINTLKKIFRKLISTLFNSIGLKMKIYNIPLNEVYYYYLTEDNIDIRYHEFESNIFKLINSLNLKCFFKSFVSLSDSKNYSDKERLNMILRNPKNDILFLYIGSPDAMGHTYGPESIIFQNYLKNLDNELKEFIEYFDKINKRKSTIIINGDHGMSQVKFIFDVKKHLIKILNSKNYQINKDYRLFFDSTLARIWSSNSELLNFIRSDKKLNELGVFVYDDFDSKLKEIYGNLIWTINHSGLIIPNYFQMTKIEGMHGYIPKKSSDYGTLIIKNPKFKHKKNKYIFLKDVHEILKNEIKSRFKN